MIVPDHIAALIELLKADARVAERCAGRVVGGTSIPDQYVAAMPTEIVVLAYSGGVGMIGVGAQSYGDVRVDTRTYGATERAASELFRAVYSALKGFQREVHANMLLHWARNAGGPLPLRDPDTGWPFVQASWQVLAGEIPVER